MRSNRKWLAGLAAIAAVGAITARIVVRAAEPGKTAATKPENAPAPPAYLDAESAGPDFLAQGEYVGTLTDAAGKKSKLAAQVAALGDGAFRAVFLPGGLPGDGWDGTTRIEVPAKTADGKTLLAAETGKPGYTGTIVNGALVGKSDKGEAFELKRVERVSSTMDAMPPAGATILFEGADTDAWVKGILDERHILAAGTETVNKFQSFSLHLEFLLPFKPKGKDQDRGNSGVYLQKRYEVQILDSFGGPPAINGTGAIYQQLPPKLNMCYPPLQWQTYDIDFTAAKFDAEGKKTGNAKVTVKLNGVVIHEDQEIKAKTGAGQKEGPEAMPIALQGHGNPVFFRNIWVLEK